MFAAFFSRVEESSMAKPESIIFKHNYTTIV